MASTRSAGRYGPRKTNRNPSPINPVGSRTHAGQISVSAPTMPANPLTLLTPRGQWPYRRCHPISPEFSARSIPTAAVNAISHVSAGGRGKDGRKCRKAPSSHAKKSPAISSVTTNGIQNDDERRRRCTEMSINKNAPLRERPCSCLITGTYEREAMKQFLQRTGRPPSSTERGLNGTWQAEPHWAQTASCISRVAPRSFLRFSRQSLQRCGALRFLLA